MNRHISLKPVAVVLTLLLVSACGSTPTRPGEPSPKDDVAAFDEQLAASDARQNGEAPAPQSPAATQPAQPPKTTTSAKPAPEAAAPAKPEAAAPAPPPPRAAAPPPPPPAPLILSSKPRIVAKVETVQFPAWVERGGVKAAIKASWAIYTGDRITTGSDGRVVLSVAGEGRLQIGGAADVAMTPAYEATGGPEPPLLTLRRGAAAFTAPMVRSGLGGTQINVRDSIGATLMGGQMLVRSDSEEDVLALVDGFVQISGPKLNPGSMKTANTVLRVPRVGRAQPVSPVPGERMAGWLSEPQLVRGRPALDASGNWDVSLNSGYNLKQLETMACRIQNRGYPSEIYPVREPGKQVWYRVVVRRFKSKNDAVDFLGTAKALGAKEPWVLLPQS